MKIDNLDAWVDHILYVDGYSGGATEQTEQLANNLEVLLRAVIGVLTTEQRDALLRRQ